MDGPAGHDDHLDDFSSDESDDEIDEYYLDPISYLRRIESNDPSLLKVYAMAGNLARHDADDMPTVRHWLELGRNIGMNTHMKELALSGVDESSIEDEGERIASPENMRIFLDGLASNRSLRSLFLEGFDFDLVEGLGPLLTYNRNLVELGLHNCNLNAQDIGGISAAFRLRIKIIKITEAVRGDEIVRAIVELAGACPQLKKLTIGEWYRESTQCCTEVARLLEDRDTKLKCLYLSEQNNIDDDGVEVLANAVAHNKTLTRLALNCNSGITSRGWGSLLRVVCDTSSINATKESNHTLEHLWDDIFDRGRTDFSDSMNLPADLLFCLKANEDGNDSEAARKKIFHFHFNGNFNIAPFNSMNLELLPTALGWIGQDYHAYGDGTNFYAYCSKKEFKQSRVLVFYRILRNFPDLCNFPSRERRLRLQAEAEISLLKSDNAAMKEDIAALRNQNNQLQFEIEQLQSAKRRKTG